MVGNEAQQRPRMYTALKLDAASLSKSLGYCVPGSASLVFAKLTYRLSQSTLRHQGSGAP